MQGLFGNNAVLGIDLGAGAVKAVEWAQGSVRKWAFALLSEPPGSSTQDSAKLIRKLVRDAAFSARRAVVGLAADQVLMHEFRLAENLPSAEIEEQTRIQAEKAAPYPVADAVYDYRQESAGDPQASYSMGIARSAVVKALCAPIEAAGLKVAAVDLTSFAIQRAFFAESAQYDAWAVIDGGFNGTRLSVYLEDGSVFQHSQPFGCRQLAQRLGAALGLAPADTLKAVEDCALPGGAVNAIRESFLEDSSRHAARALQLYLASRRAAAPPERLFLCGGAALVHGARDAIANALAMPVEVAEPLRPIAGGKAAPDCSPALLGAFALALNDHA